MRLQSLLGAIGLAMMAIFGISQTVLGQTRVDKTLEAGAITKFIAIGTLASPGSMPTPSFALQEEQAILRLYLNGKVEQFWLREDGNGIVFLMAASTREEAAGLLQKLPYAQRDQIRVHTGRAYDVVHLAS